MKILCIYQNARDIPEKSMKVSGTSNTEFSVSIGNEYIVYGMMLWKGVIKYLIVGNHDKPSWYPAELFEVKNDYLPLEWYFDFSITENLEAIWGYSELVHDSEHFDLLQERDSNAIKIFLKRKQEIEEMLSY